MVWPIKQYAVPEPVAFALLNAYDSEVSIIHCGTVEVAAQAVDEGSVRGTIPAIS